MCIFVANGGTSISRFTLHPLRTAGSLLSVVCATRRLNQRLRVSLQTIGQTFDGQVSQDPAIMGAACDRNWYAVYTVPQHEKSALKQLDIREIESFLPTYETVRVWKNRQRMSSFCLCFQHICLCISIPGSGRRSSNLPVCYRLWATAESVSLFPIPRSSFCAPTSAGNG